MTDYKNEETKECVEFYQELVTSWKPNAQRIEEFLVNCQKYY